MMRARILASLLAAGGCGEVKNGGTGGTGGGAACGQRGQPCCAASMCDPRASCDGTACIAADVWASEVDGTFNFNGGTWTQPLVSGTTQPVPGVNGLWGTTANFVVGVGAGGLILRKDGNGWHKDAVGASDGTGTLDGVSGSGPSDVWAVGDGHLAHWSGSSWTDVTPPQIDVPYFAVWLSGPGEGWAVGELATRAHLSSGSWTDAGRSGNGYTLYGVWGSSPSDVWAVGARHTLNGLPLNILHYDGSMWSDGSLDLDPQGRMPPLRAVWGADATHVWAVGEGGTVIFWNGTLWTSVLTGAATTETLRSVWGSGPRDVWVAGSAGVRHFNGAAWSVVAGRSAPLALWLSAN